MKIWFLRIRHVPTCNGKDEGPGVPWVHGKCGVFIPEEELTDDWLLKNGYKTLAAAKRGLGASPRSEIDPFWREVVTIDSRDIPVRNLKVKIYRCYEIVILDSDGNQIGESDYVYTNRKDAEEMAIHKLAMTEEEVG